MTTPHERCYALVQAHQVLQELARLGQVVDLAQSLGRSLKSEQHAMSEPDAAPDPAWDRLRALSKQALGVLRHYPDPQEIEQAARILSHRGNGGESLDWVPPWLA